ncbi:VanZ family protein [Planctomonas sp. JC2975]|uniref:VanZ family protein n=1 Tax=Planctomonas sp. JC2975 TaxID=2729626 RepID=UPI001472D5F3|nr:VanZ family protein [Planctomonas sp. JC2975]NNC11043.1 VanZ family protein [Planctomonas sp. JC2975]
MTPRVKAWSWIVLAAYIVVLLWLVLFKFTPDVASVLTAHERSVNVIPFAGSTWRSVEQMTLNLIAFIPFGLLMSVTVKRLGFWSRFLVIVAFSGLVELTQYVFAIGASDITDVITNAAGGLAGLALYALLARRFRSASLDRAFLITVGALLVLCVAIIGYFLLHGVRYQVHPPAR